MAGQFKSVADLLFLRQRLTKKLACDAARFIKLRQKSLGFLLFMRIVLIA